MYKKKTNCTNVTPQKKYKHAELSCLYRAHCFDTYAVCITKTRRVCVYTLNVCAFVPF